jgi:hypothetical protein
MTNARNPTLMTPSTPSTRAANVGDRLRLKADRDRPCRQRQGPQQQRALVRAPHRGEAVERRQRSSSCWRRTDREIVLVERPREHRERQRDERRTARHGWPRRPPSSVDCRAPAPPGRRRPARRTAAAPVLARTDRVQRPCDGCSGELASYRVSANGSIRRPAAGSSGGRCFHVRLEAVLHFGRHVVLVVLGQHLFGDEHTVVTLRAAGDDALPFAEQVRQDARVADAHVAGSR